MKSQKEVDVQKFIAKIKWLIDKEGSSLEIKKSSCN